LISESEILRSFQHLVEENDKDFVIIGSGDDAAVIKAQKKDLIHSTDISKEGTHFPINSNPEDIAYRSIAVALSDLAAMGAYPSFITVGLTSNKTDIKWYNDFTRGLEKIIKEYDIKLVGGDVTFGDLNVCINVFGYSYVNPLLRSTAKPNELIYITGTLGKGRKGLTDWQNSKQSKYQLDFFRPKARFDMAEFISSFASSCIDVSDGLIKDLGSICKLSNVGAILNYEDIPITNDIKDLSYGDDYELCFTCEKQFEEKLKTKGLKSIGKIVDELGVKLVKENKIINFTKTGWDSFE